MCDGTVSTRHCIKCVTLDISISWRVCGEGLSKVYEDGEIGYIDFKEACGVEYVKVSV